MTTTRAKDSCTNCLKPITEPPTPTICPNCTEGRDIDGTPSTIRYCSALCLESDTKNLDQQQHHIDDCKARNIRKELYRAGDFLQKVFYIWTEIAFRYDVVRVERVEERIYLSHRSGSEEDEEEDGREEDATGEGGEGPFYAFPFEICKGEDEMKALLSWMACNDAPQMVLELSRKVLGGITSSIESVFFLLDSGSYTVIDEEYPFDGPHEVLVMDAHDGNSYVLDLSGFQIGLESPVIPLQEYMEEFGTQIVGIYEHDSAITQLEILLRAGTADPGYGRIYATHHHMYEALNKVVNAGERIKRQSLSELLRSDQRSYVRGMRYHENRIRTALRQLFAIREQQGHPRISAAAHRLKMDSLTRRASLQSSTLEGTASSAIQRQWDKEGRTMPEEVKQAVEMASPDLWDFQHVAKAVPKLSPPLPRDDKPRRRSWPSRLARMWKRWYRESEL